MKRLFQALLPRRHRSVTLYGKPGCHLCDDARRMLERLHGRYTFTLEEIDITRDAETFREYDIRIPVIVVDGQTTLEAPLRETDLRRALAAGWARRRLHL